MCGLNLRAYPNPDSQQIHRMARLVAAREPDVVLLQECKRGWLEPVCEPAGLDGVHAHHVAPDTPRSAYPPDGTAIAVRAPLRIERAWRIPPEDFLPKTVQEQLFEEPPHDLEPLPDRLAQRYSGRSLLAEIHGGSQPFVAGSFHATPGTSTVGGARVHERKPFFHGAVALHLAQLDQPFVFAIDANEPLTESADSVGFHWADGRSGVEKFRALLGLEPIHRGRDLFREWHHGSGLVAASPDLLVPTYAPGPDFQRRFDSIWATPDFTVDDFVTELADVVAAGGDHAMLVADLRLRPVGAAA
ncbi:endonuclease/exonuclease/phosphatase family protein [Salsipaludibacter albus]|uniref:endonuclease/exonuclease/phosphatase family protein n=1 Tax=Salsipaludibacter albus TaxID=2849650 RepID=UPI001EE427EC|nr:endonuclease/exonuclease/phosphatase family protein [Salsipaludibacter albus]MBY5162102.1 endonuclease/exonuclease/phosphatase family protein [Salsipaludibacter albus]